ncbi:chromatin organization modifier protein [Ordospora colligata]|nr:chromatin organization modifier protein [Ordospora colligata]
MSAEDVYVVEKVVASRTLKGVKQYLLKWQGYPDSDNTWENEKNIFCKDMIQEYENTKAMPNKKQKKGKQSNLNPSEAKATQNPQESAAEQESYGTNKRKSRSQKDKNELQNNNKQSQEGIKRKPRAKSKVLPDTQAKIDNLSSAVDKVISVEMNDSKNGLVVYLLFKNGENGKFPAEIIHEKCPIPLLEYYESNLVFCEDGVDASK